MSPGTRSVFFIPVFSPSFILIFRGQPVWKVELSGCHGERSGRAWHGAARASFIRALIYLNALEHRQGQLQQLLITIIIHPGLDVIDKTGQRHQFYQFGTS